MLRGPVANWKLSGALHFYYPRSATGTPCTRSILAMGYMVEDSRVMRRESSWGLGLFGGARFVLATGERRQLQTFFNPRRRPPPSPSTPGAVAGGGRGDGRQCMAGSLFPCVPTVQGSSPPPPDPWSLDARAEVVAGYPSWKKRTGTMDATPVAPSKRNQSGFLSTLYSWSNMHNAPMPQYCSTP
jgi:hypothetical protein